MITLRGLSIPKKIVVITVIVSAAALLLASAALIGYDYIAARRDLRVGTTTLAQIVADEVTAAVSFNDRNAALDTLNALRSEPSLVQACVYSEMRLFAGHTFAGATACPPSPLPASRTADLSIIAAPIQLKGKNIGSVVLTATLGPTYGRLRLEIAITTVILALSVAFAFGLAARLHKIVSEPILKLARTADQVSRSKDYSVQVNRQNTDELGILVDSFNEMMRQIRARDADLQARTTALEAANQELRKTAKMKDEFLATLSHELRTPLTSIFGWISLLKTGKLDDDKARQALNVIDRNARTQMQLVEDLLDVSEIVTGKLKITPRWTTAKAIIDPAVDTIRPAAEAKQIRIVQQIANPEEPVFADHERIQQVIWNLLINAIKFSEMQSEIRVEGDRVGSAYQIRVSDNGEGIDPDFAPHLFERFTQADSSSTRRHGGLGLGLAIVRHIVESHGGSVSAFSKGKGLGASFTVSLPIPERSSSSGGDAT